MHRVDYGHDFSNAPLLPMIATPERARIVADELVRKLQKSGVPCESHVEILNLPPFGYEVRATIDVNGSPKDLKTLDDILANIGIEPELVPH